MRHMNNITNILLLGNASVQRMTLDPLFKAAGQRVVLAMDAASLSAELAQNCPHIVMVDIDLLDREPLHAIQTLRRDHPALGIIIYTADQNDVVEGLKAGADCVYAGPLNADVMMVLFNALERRLGNVLLDAQWLIQKTERMLVAPDGTAVTLSARDFCVLHALMHAPGRTVTRRQIIVALNENFLAFDQRRLDTQIRRLRVLSVTHLGCKLPLNTVHGVGYVFSAPALLAH